MSAGSFLLVFVKVRVISVPEVPSLLNFESLREFSLREKQSSCVLNGIVVYLLRRWGLSSLSLKDWGFCGLATVKYEGLESGSDLPLCFLWDGWVIRAGNHRCTVSFWLYQLYINTRWRQEIRFTIFLWARLWQVPKDTHPYCSDPETLFWISEVNDYVCHDRLPQHKNLSGSTVPNMSVWGLLLANPWQLSVPWRCQGQTSELAWRG